MKVMKSYRNPIVGFLGCAACLSAVQGMLPRPDGELAPGRTGRTAALRSLAGRTLDQVEHSPWLAPAPGAGDAGFAEAPAQTGDAAPRPELAAELAAWSGLGEGPDDDAYAQWMDTPPPFRAHRLTALADIIRPYPEPTVRDGRRRYVPRTTAYAARVAQILRLLPESAEGHEPADPIAEIPTQTGGRSEALRDQIGGIRPETLASMHALNDQRTLSIGQYAPVWLHGSPAQKELLLTDKNSAVPRNVLALLFNVPTPYGRDTFPRETTLEHLTQLVLRGADPKVTFQRDGRSYHGVSTLIRQASRATRAYRLGITCGRAIQLFGSYRAYFGRKEAATIRQLTALESFAKWLESRETE